MRWMLRPRSWVGSRTPCLWVYYNNAKWSKLSYSGEKKWKTGVRAWDHWVLTCLHSRMAGSLACSYCSCWGLESVLGVYVFSGTQLGMGDANHTLPWEPFPSLDQNHASERLCEMKWIVSQWLFYGASLFLQCYFLQRSICRHAGCNRKLWNERNGESVSLFGNQDSDQNLNLFLKCLNGCLPATATLSPSTHTSRFLPSSHAHRHVWENDSWLFCPCPLKMWPVPAGSLEAFQTCLPQPLWAAELPFLTLTSKRVC